MRTLELGGSPRQRRKRPTVRTALDICREMGIPLWRFYELLREANQRGLNLNPVKGEAYRKTAQWAIDELIQANPDRFAVLRPPNAWTKLLEDGGV